MKVLVKLVNVFKGNAAKMLKKVNVKKIVKIVAAASGIAITAFLFLRPDENYTIEEKVDEIKEGVDE